MRRPGQVVPRGGGAKAESGRRYKNVRISAQRTRTIFDKASRCACILPATKSIPVSPQKWDSELSHSSHPAQFVGFSPFRAVFAPAAVPAQRHPRSGATASPFRRDRTTTPRGGAELSGKSPRPKIHRPARGGKTAAQYDAELARTERESRGMKETTHARTEIAKGNPQ